MSIIHHYTTTITPRRSRVRESQVFSKSQRVHSPCFSLKFYFPDIRYSSKCSSNLTTTFSTGHPCVWKMGQSKSQTLPILPLPQGSVLLPGVTLRIPVANRTDIPALLTSVFTKDKRPRVDATAILIGCVPINSPLLRSDGQQLLDDGNPKRMRRIDDEHTNPSDADHRDLFMYGTVAKISGVQGRRADDLSLIVEGIRRFRIDRFIQMRPYFEAEVAYLDDEGMHTESSR